MGIMGEKRQATEEMEKTSLRKGGKDELPQRRNKRSNKVIKMEIRSRCRGFEVEAATEEEMLD